MLAVCIVCPLFLPLPFRGSYKIVVYKNWARGQAESQGNLINIVFSKYNLDEMICNRIRILYLEA